MTRRAVALLLAAGVGLGLTGCDDRSDESSSKAGSSVNPTAVPSSGASGSSSPVAPSIPPAAADGLTVTSAEAFARFYLAAMDHLVATGDAALVRQWADTGCVACKTLADHYERMYQDGGAVTGDFRVKIVDVKKATLIGDDTAAVLIRATEGRQAERRNANAAPSVLPGGPYMWDLTLAAANGHWVMFEMEQTA